MRNFGHDGTENYFGLGINGKNSEFHAAMGLCNLKYIDAILAKRKADCAYYDEKLKELNVKRPKPVAGAESNYSYYPIIFETEELLKEQAHVLAQNLVNTRRYFYPSLTGLPYVKKQKTPVSNSISRRVLCLPLYYDLAKEEIDMITRLLLRTQNNR